MQTNQTRLACAQLAEDLDLVTPSIPPSPCDCKPEIMEEEDDDFYDPTDSVPAPQEANNVHGAAPDQVQDDNEVDDEEVEVEEDEVRSQQSLPR